jgi:DNA-binding NarL/FixJ family response regulator
LLGNALSWSGRGAEADTELAALGTMARTDPERVNAAIPRAATLAWGLGRPTEAKTVLETAANAVSDDAVTLELTGMHSVVDVFLGQTVRGAAVAAEVLAHPRRSSAAMDLATWGLVAAGGGLGRIDGLDEKVQQIDVRAASFQTGLHQAASVASSWVRGLQLAGLLDQADRIGQHYRQLCQDTPGPGYAVTSVMCGQVAKSRGLVKTAARWFRQALAARGGADIGGWWFFTLLVDLPGVLGMVGEAVLARQAFVEMTAARSPAFAFLDPEVLLAQAWVVASEGSVSDAVGLARRAAETAASQDQHAVEVVALHTAVCFGDRTLADRLAQLATQVDGPLAPAAAAHAAALAADDGPALLAASIQLEQIGTLLLAADAAAQAAAAHTRHHRHGSAHAASARTHRLAQACEGARTPALAALTAPLLTPREREIVALAARGLSNRQIAQQLVISVRTVENHLYRACLKLDVSDRAELTTVLHNN